MARIKKEKRHITAYSEAYKISGKVFLPPGGRMSDFLGGVSAKKYVPVTDAVVTDKSGNEVCRTDFLELNTDRLVFLVPEGEKAVEEEEEK